MVSMVVPLLSPLPSLFLSSPPHLSFLSICPFSLPSPFSPLLLFSKHSPPPFILLSPYTPPLSSPPLSLSSALHLAFSPLPPLHPFLPTLLSLLPLPDHVPSPLPFSALLPYSVLFPPSPSPPLPLTELPSSPSHLFLPSLPPPHSLSIRTFLLSTLNSFTLHYLSTHSKALPQFSPFP